jgi:hypothetical protein
MKKTVDTLNIEEDAGGTGAISFRATGVQKHWQVQNESELDVEESEKVLGQDEALKKVIRNTKK